jgi:hypothetical protein
LLNACHYDIAIAITIPIAIAIAVAGISASASASATSAVSCAISGHRGRVRCDSRSIITASTAAVAVVVDVNHFDALRVGGGSSSSSSSSDGHCIRRIVRLWPLCRRPAAAERGQAASARVVGTFLPVSGGRFPFGASALGRCRGHRTATGSTADLHKCTERAHESRVNRSEQRDAREPAKAREPRPER